MSMGRGVEREEGESGVRVTVPIEWYLGALAAQLPDKPRKRSTREEIFYRQLSEIEERKGKLIELFRAGKLTARFYQISLVTKSLIKRALRALDSQNGNKDINRVTEEAASHYWFYYNPQIREEVKAHNSNNPWRPNRESMERLIGLWGTSPDLQTYLDQVPHRAQELVYFYLQLCMIGAQTIPPELKLDNAA